MIVIMSMVVFCSILGYIMLTREKLKLQTEFIPIFVCSAIACVVYFCGLIGYLFPGSIFLLVVGILMFVMYFIKVVRKRTYLNFKPSLFHVTFIVGSLFFFYLLAISKLIHYDNFSHWAIVLKQMLITNSFPDAGSVLIDFKNYPLGISSFIYFICRFVGHAQGIMLASQFILIFTCFYAIFGIIKEKKRFLLYVFLASGCSALSIFNITIRIDNLLVDFLLPIYTLVLFVVIYVYQREIKNACITIIPLAGLLMITKSTGIIFAGIGLVYLAYVWLKNNDKPLYKNGVRIFISILASFAPYTLWMLHMAHKFQGVKNKFEASANNIQSISGDKSMEDIRQIILLFVKAVFDIKSRQMMGIIGFNIAAILASIFVTIVIKKNWKLWKALIALDMVLIGYYVGILGLYIFSMPLDEAMALAGFDRYASSIVILFVGGLIICATVDIENSFYYKVSEMPAHRAYKSIQSKERYQNGVIILTALAVTLLMSEYNGMKSIQNSYKNTLPYRVYQVTGDRWPLDGKVDESRYLFYASDINGQVTDYYMQYIAKYMLYASNVDGICDFYEDNLINLLGKYDKLVIAESDSEERYMLKKYFGVSGGKGCYKIVHLGDTLVLELIQ